MSSPNLFQDPMCMICNANYANEGLKQVQHDMFDN